MFNVGTIKTELLSMIGWRQNPDPNGEKLLELTTSTTGLFFNDEHPMLTLENLHSVSPDSDQYVYDLFDAIKTDYAVGDRVKDGTGVLYERIKTDPVAQPLNDTEFWKLYSLFTDWLKEKTESGIIQAINDWYSKKSKFSTVRNLLSREKVFCDGGDFDDIQTKEGNVVGQYIRPKSSNEVIMKINEISIQMDTNQAVTVKLFKKGTKTPIVTEAFVYANNGGVQWFTPIQPDKWELEGGGLYFIGYDEDAITGNAINVVSSLYGFSTYVFPSKKYYSVASFSVDSDFTEMWNESDVIYTTSTNYGLNYKVSVGCDYTEFIVEQKDLFKIAIAKRVAILLLRELPFNANALVNRNEKNVDDAQIFHDIDGDSQSTPGNNHSLRQQYDSAIMDIQFDQTGIDKVCLPCRKRGVHYGTIKRGHGYY